MSVKDIGIRLEKTKMRIAEIAADAGRAPNSVRLVAVSKTLPPATVRAAYEAGQRCFGENRVQELEEKADALPEDCEWHMIGHLQRNKVKAALRYATYIHSVDSEKLLNRIDRIAGEYGRNVQVLFEVNVSGEDSKYGIDTDETAGLLRASLNCANVTCRGLMTMAPFGADARRLHAVFGGLRSLRDQLEDRFEVPLPELSMGMSSDYEIAIREGATMVRIGTAIFGARS